MAKKKPRISVIPIEVVQQQILVLRGQRVIIDSDLATLYGVTTKRLNEQIKRNTDRFPDDFMFKITPDEKREVVANCDHLRNLKFSPQLPHAFTEHGAIMAATVLNSPQAVNTSLFVVRAFVQLRQFISTHHELAAKLSELEHKLENHDGQILALIDAIRQLMDEPDDSLEERSPVGFHTELAGPKTGGTRKKLRKS